VSFPSDVYYDPSWSRARRLDALARDLVAGADLPPTGAETAVGYLLDRLRSYRQGVLAAFTAAADGLARMVLGPEDPLTGASLNHYARLLLDAPKHPLNAKSLGILASVLYAWGDLAGARPLYERALAIYETALGPEHPNTTTSLDDLAGLLRAQGDLAGARPLYERALAIREKALGPEHPNTATSLNDLAGLLRAQGDLAGARPLYERALAIREKALGPEHPDTIRVRGNLAYLRRADGAPPTR
jgi:tetratricopeptide (TPR) repeat protein